MMNRRRSLLTDQCFAGVRSRPRPIDPVMLKIRQELDRRFQEIEVPHVLSPSHWALRLDRRLIDLPPAGYHGERR